MKTIKAIVANTTTQQPASDCNYADNYYGDRVCVQRPQTK